jgi:hypothetical protein
MIDERVLDALKSEVALAKQNHQTAREQFWQVVRRHDDVQRFTAGVPHPDGNQIIHKASVEETFARNAHFEALQRLIEYLMRGTVPAHLKAISKSAGAGGAHDDEFDAG